MVLPMTAPRLLPHACNETSAWVRRCRLFVEKGNRSGPKRSVEGYRRMLWPFRHAREGRPDPASGPVDRPATVPLPPDRRSLPSAQLSEVQSIGRWSCVTPSPWSHVRLTVANRHAHCPATGARWDNLSHPPRGPASRAVPAHVRWR